MSFFNSLEPKQDLTKHDGGPLWKHMLNDADSEILLHELRFSKLNFIDWRDVIKYDSKENGYNSDVGGGIQKTVYQYSIEDGSLVNTYDSLQNSANAVNTSKASIGNACTGQNKTCKGYVWSYFTHTSPMKLTDERRKPLIQMDIRGLTLAKDRSVAEALRQTGISKTCISRVCISERTSAEGFLWRYS